MVQWRAQMENSGGLTAEAGMKSREADRSRSALALLVASSRSQAIVSSDKPATPRAPAQRSRPTECRLMEKSGGSTAEAGMEKCRRGG